MLTHLYEDFHNLPVKVLISPYRSKKKAANHCGLAVYHIRKANTVLSNSTHWNIFSRPCSNCFKSLHSPSLFRGIVVIFWALIVSSKELTKETKVCYGSCVEKVSDFVLIKKKVSITQGHCFLKWGNFKVEIDNFPLLHFQVVLLVALWSQRQH